MERIAICPGSFDPITKGHQEIILRARKLFDRVIVVVSENPDKHPVFSVEERVGMIRTVSRISTMNSRWRSPTARWSRTPKRSFSPRAVR